jgi:carbonic anhydrase/acetyltransferase-like protein (isoleucine patch superfamily)
MSRLARLHPSSSTGSVFPLGQPASSILFGGKTLRAWQDEAAAACGLGVVDVDDGGVVPADVVGCCAADVLFSAETLRALLDAQKARGRPVRAALPLTTALGTASTRLTELDDARGGALAALRVAVPLVVGGGLHDDAEPFVIDDDGAVDFDVRPYGLPPHVLRLARVPRLLGWPRHWLHVLDLSLAALQTRLLRGEARSKHRRRAAPRIHPTAIVENAILGDNVRIEAHASVIDSVIGDDVLVADHSVIHTSVVGPRCRTLVDTHLRRVVAMGDSTLSNLDMQDALFGEGVFVTTGVAFFAEGPGQNVVVDGRDSGRSVLGGAVGRGAILGSRALFRSGVAVPAGALVVARPEEAVGKFDAGSLGRAAMIIGDRSTHS